MSVEEYYGRIAQAIYGSTVEADSMEVVREVLKGGSVVLRTEFMGTLARVFKSYDPLFDEDGFYDACMGLRSPYMLAD